MVEQCAGLKAEPAKIIMGGPMMGAAQLALDLPAIRGTSGVLIFRKGDMPLSSKAPVSVAAAASGLPGAHHADHHRRLRPPRSD